jgi:hypothetical protein
LIDSEREVKEKVSNEDNETFKSKFLTNTEEFKILTSLKLTLLKTHEDELTKATEKLYVKEKIFSITLLLSKN